MSNLTTSYKPTSVVSNSFTLGAVLTSAAIVIGPPVGTLYGYSSGGSLGALNPNTFNGSTIIAIFSTSSSGLTEISISGSHAQNFFTSITINGTTLLSADANFFPLSPTVWEFSSSVLVGIIGDVPVAFS